MIIEGFFGAVPYFDLLFLLDSFFLYTKRFSGFLATFLDGIGIGVERRAKTGMTERGWNIGLMLGY